MPYNDNSINANDNHAQQETNNFVNSNQPQQVDLSCQDTLLSLNLEEKEEEKNLVKLGDKQHQVLSPADVEPIADGVKSTCLSDSFNCPSDATINISNEDNSALVVAIDEINSRLKEANKENNEPEDDDDYGRGKIRSQVKKRIAVRSQSSPSSLTTHKFGLRNQPSLSPPRLVIDHETGNIVELNSASPGSSGLQRQRAAAGHEPTLEEQTNDSYQDDSDYQEDDATNATFLADVEDYDTSLALASHATSNKQHPNELDYYNPEQLQQPHLATSNFQFTEQQQAMSDDQTQSKLQANSSKVYYVQPNFVGNSSLQNSHLQATDRHLPPMTGGDGRSKLPPHIESAIAKQLSPSLRQALSELDDASRTDVAFVPAHGMGVTLDGEQCKRLTRNLQAMSPAVAVATLSSLAGAHPSINAGRHISPHAHTQTHDAEGVLVQLPAHHESHRLSLAHALPTPSAAALATKPTVTIVPSGTCCAIPTTDTEQQARRINNDASVKHADKKPRLDSFKLHDLCFNFRALLVVLISLSIIWLMLNRLAGVCGAYRPMHMHVSVMVAFVNIACVFIFTTFWYASGVTRTLYSNLSSNAFIVTIYSILSVVNLTLAIVFFLVNTCHFQRLITTEQNLGPIAYYEIESTLTSPPPGIDWLTSPSSPQVGSGDEASLNFSDEQGAGTSLPPASPVIDGNSAVHYVGRRSGGVNVLRHRRQQPDQSLSLPSHSHVARDVSSVYVASADGDGASGTSGPSGSSDTILAPQLEMVTTTPPPQVNGAEFADITMSPLEAAWEFAWSLMLEIRKSFSRFLVTYDLKFLGALHAICAMCLQFCAMNVAVVRSHFYFASMVATN